MNPDFKPTCCVLTTQPSYSPPPPTNLNAKNEHIVLDIFKISKIRSIFILPSQFTLHCMKALPSHCTV